MTENTVSEIERMVVTRVFDAPRELVWKAWTDPKYVMQWWGPEGFTAPVCRTDVRVGGKSLCCMKTPDGQEFWNAIEYHEIVLHEKIVSLMYFSDAEGNKIDPAQLGIEHEAIEGAYDVTLFEDLGNGQTKLTFIGNETMQNAIQSGQLEGTKQILDKVAAVVAELALGGGEIRGSSLDDRHARDSERKANAGPSRQPQPGVAAEALFKRALVTWANRRLAG
jgi:uncharacterized protein YndB with AHSA1/START domain